MLNDTVKERLIGQARKLATWSNPRQPDLKALPLHHEGGSLLGHVLLDLLEESGYLPEDISAIAAYNMESLTAACSLMHAAGARGLDIDVVSLLDGDIPNMTEGGKTVVILDLAPSNTLNILQAKQQLQTVGWQVLCVLALVSPNSKVDSELQEAGVKYMVSLSVEDIK